MSIKLLEHLKNQLVELLQYQDTLNRQLEFKQRNLSLTKAESYLVLSENYPDTDETFRRSLTKKLLSENQAFSELTQEIGELKAKLHNIKIKELEARNAYDLAHMEMQIKANQSQ